VKWSTSNKPVGQMKSTPNNGKEGEVGDEIKVLIDLLQEQNTDWVKSNGVTTVREKRRKRGESFLKRKFPVAPGIRERKKQRKKK